MNRLMLLVPLKKVWICGMTQLKSKIECCRPILDIEVEGCLAVSPGPDMYNLFEATEKESLLGAVKGGGVLVHLLAL